MDILLALGGGGSKGNAHIGVLRVLEREGYRVRAIAGTSAGGMVASAYAAGLTPDDLENYMKRVDQRSFFGFHLGTEPALLGIKGIANAMKEVLSDRIFEDLKIPCALTAVDLDTGQEMVLREGLVLDAVLATIAIPGIFPPRNWGSSLLVDGGVINPVPVSVVRDISPQQNLPVVAVTLTSSPTERGLLPPLGPKAAEAVLHRIARLRVAQALEMFLRSIEIGMSSITELRLQMEKPEVVIRPDVSKIGYLDLVNVPEVVKLGEEAAEAVLPDLVRVVSWRGRLSRWLD